MDIVPSEPHFNVILPCNTGQDGNRRILEFSSIALMLSERNKLGGLMSSVFRSRLFRKLSALFFIGIGVLVGWPAESLMVQLVTEHGSPGGNILRIVLVCFLLALGALFFIAGLINWTRSRRGEQNMGS